MPLPMPRPRTEHSSDRTIADQVARRIRKQIILGQIAPGKHLKEVQLAEQFDVSRSTIREVLRRLEGENLVEMFAHRGARIARFGPSDAVEIYELHAMLEEYSIRRVPLPIDDALHDQLAAVVEQMGRLSLPEDVDLIVADAAERWDYVMGN